MLDVLIFDLDETIYPRGSGLMRAISQRISQYMIERLFLDPAVVPALRHRYWEDYGTTSRGLQRHHSLDVDDYMRFVHELPLGDFIGPDPELGEALGSLPQRKVIFTNATADHAWRVLDVMGIAGHFTEVYDVVFAGHEGKPSPDAYVRLLGALGAAGDRCLMAEDTARNLRPAKSLGMTTVLVDPQPGTDLDGVDHVVERASEIANLVLTLGGA